MPSTPDTKLDALRRDLDRLSDLPPAPRVVTEIWRVLADEDTSVRALATVVERDPALAAKILRLANSAYFGLRQPVRDVRAACVVLGFSTIESLAVGVSSLQALSRSVGTALDLDGFWRHSVGTALAAERLARRIGIPDVGAAFCGGIIHDIGKLVLATLSPDRYRGVLEASGDEPLAEREAREYGADHAAVGGWLAERWRLPVELAEMVRGHHDPDGEVGGRWAALVHLADALASGAGCASPGAGFPAGAPGPPALPAVLPVGEALLADVAAALSADTDRIDTFVATTRAA